MLDDAVTDKVHNLEFLFFICGNQSDLDGRIVVLRKSDKEIT